MRPRIIAGFLALLFSSHASAVASAPALPFVDAREFNFDGGTGTSYVATVASDGRTKIYHLGFCGVTLLYNDRYRPRMSFGDGDLVAFTAKQAHLFATNGTRTTKLTRASWLTKRFPGDYPLRAWCR
jgi:hypothetical protein